MKLFLLASLVLLFSGGCATILKGSTQSINVDSNVAGAAVYVNGQMVGRTPFTGKINRSKEIRLRVEKEGYTSRTLSLDTTLEPVIFLNLFSNGAFGSTTDLATASAWKVSPNIYNIDLQKKQ